MCKMPYVSVPKVLSSYYYLISVHLNEQILFFANVNILEKKENMKCDLSTNLGTFSQPDTLFE